MKKYINTAITYAILALGFGVFYREFTKFSNFNGRTTLAFIHGHYLVLGMIGFLSILIFDKLFNVSGNKKFSTIIVAYQIGLNITTLSFLARGILQVKNITVSSGVDASISGISGIGHIILGVSLILILFKIKKSVLNGKNEN